MSNRFTAVLRSLYHKSELILFTLLKLTLCVCLQKFPCFSTIFHIAVRRFAYIGVINIENMLFFAWYGFIIVFVYVVL